MGRSLAGHKRFLRNTVGRCSEKSQGGCLRRHGGRKYVRNLRYMIASGQENTHSNVNKQSVFVRTSDQVEKVVMVSDTERGMLSLELGAGDSVKMPVS